MGETIFERRLNAKKQSNREFIGICGSEAGTTSPIFIPFESIFGERRSSFLSLNLPPPPFLSPPPLLFISVFSRRELSRGRCKFSSFYLAASIRYRAETTRQISTCRSDLRLSFISCPFARLRRNSKHTDRQRGGGTPPFPFSKSRVSSCRTSNALKDHFSRIT